MPEKLGEKHIKGFSKQTCTLYVLKKLPLLKSTCIVEGSSSIFLFLVLSCHTSLGKILWHIWTVEGDEGHLMFDERVACRLLLAQFFGSKAPGNLGQNNLAFPSRQKTIVPSVNGFSRPKAIKREQTRHAGDINESNPVNEAMIDLTGEEENSIMVRSHTFWGLKWESDEGNTYDELRLYKDFSLSKPLFSSQPNYSFLCIAYMAYLMRWRVRDVMLRPFFCFVDHSLFSCLIFEDVMLWNELSSFEPKAKFNAHVWIVIL